MKKCTDEEIRWAIGKIEKITLPGAVWTTEPPEKAYVKIQAYARAFLAIVPVSDEPRTHTILSPTEPIVPVDWLIDQINQNFNRFPTPRQIRDVFDEYFMLAEEIVQFRDAANIFGPGYVKYDR